MGTPDTTPEVAEKTPLDELQERAKPLQAKRQSLELEEAILRADFKRIFETAMIEIKPGIFVIIKPSRRQDISIAQFWDTSETNIHFRNTDRQDVPLHEHEDYIFYYENGPLTPADLSGPFLTQVSTELN